MADALEVQRVEEQEPAQRRERADRDRARPRERRAAEEAHLEERLPAAELVENERHEAREREREQRQDPRRRPAGPGSLDDRVGQRRQRRDHEQLPDRVEPARVRGTRLGHERGGQHERDRADRDVHEEHRAPPDRVHEGPAEDRPERHAQSEHRAPHPDRDRALARVVEHVADDRHRDRVEHRSPDCLKHPERDQQLQGRGDPAQERAEREHHEPRLEHPLAPDAVGGRSRQHQQAGQHQRVGVDRPTAGPTPTRAGRCGSTGSATFTIVESRPTISRLRQQIPRISSRWRRLGDPSGDAFSRSSINFDRTQGLRDVTVTATPACRTAP